MRKRIWRPPASFGDVLDSMAATGDPVSIGVFAVRGRLSLIHARLGPGDSTGHERPPSDRYDTEDLAIAQRPLPSTSPLDVASELNLQPSMSHAELMQIRRHFAAVNHPDVAQPHERTAATTRMQIANALIDHCLSVIVTIEHET